MLNHLIFFCCVLIPSALYGQCRLSLHLIDSWSEGAVQVLVLEGASQDSESTSFTKGKHLTLFQKQARQDLPTVNPLELIRRQMKIFKKAGLEKRVFPNVLAQSSRWIGPISCLEASLMNLYGTGLKKPLYGDYSEFGAYVLSGPLAGGLRIYFQMNPETALLPFSQKIAKAVAQDLNQGYRLSFHLHNHPFHRIESSGDLGGTIVPSGEGMSGGDLLFYAMLAKKFDLQEARITNGFHTLRVPARELDLLVR